MVVVIILSKLLPVVVTNVELTRRGFRQVSVGSVRLVTIGLINDW